MTSPILTASEARDAAIIVSEYASRLRLDSYSSKEATRERAAKYDALADKLEAIAEQKT